MWVRLARTCSSIARSGEPAVGRGRTLGAMNMRWLGISLVVVLGTRGVAWPGDPPPVPGAPQEGSRSEERPWALTQLDALPQAVRRLDLPYLRTAYECAITLGWMERVLSPKIPRLTSTRSFHVFCKLGPRGDDAIVGHWDVEGTRVTVLDGRTLILVIERGDDAETLADFWDAWFGPREPVENGPPRVSVIRYEGRLPTGERYGTAAFEAPYELGLRLPARWFRTATRTVVEFEKVARLSHYVSRRPIRYHLAQARKLIDGLPPSDPRPYLRYGPDNRDELAASQARALNAALDRSTSPLELGPNPPDELRWRRAWLLPWREAVWIRQRALTEHLAERGEIEAALMAIAVNLKVADMTRAAAIHQMLDLGTPDVLRFCAEHVGLVTPVVSARSGELHRWQHPCQWVLRQAGWPAVPYILERLANPTTPTDELGPLAFALVEACGKSAALALLEPTRARAEREGGKQPDERWVDIRSLVTDPPRPRHLVPPPPK